MAFIVYGSLYPFDFADMAFGQAGLNNFLSTWRLAAPPGDILGNIALFVPFGILGQLYLVRHRSRLTGLLVVSLVGAFLATSLQALQIFLPTRDAAMGDVFWNLCGGTFGALLVWPRAVRDRLLGYAGKPVRLFPIGLLGCWLASQWIPFVPSIDLQSIKDSLKPLLDSPRLASAQAFEIYTAYLVVACIAASLWPSSSRTPHMLLAVSAIVLGKILIVQNAVSSTYVLAAFLAVVTWLAVLQSNRFRATILAACLSISISVNALDPFTLHSPPLPFSWIPFAGLLDGSMLTNSQAVTAKLFSFGALICLAEMAGFRRLPAIAAVAMLVTLLEIAQIWVGQHTPELTDPLIVLLLGAALCSLSGEKPGLQANDTATAPAEPGRSLSPAMPPLSPETGTWRPGLQGRVSAYPRLSKEGLVIAVAACVVVSGATQIALDMPRVPYNVRELFGGENTWWRLFVFTAAMVSIGLGAAAVGHATARSRHWIAVLPGATFASCLVTYLLLVSSVTLESISDIAGSANTYWFVMNRDMWGAQGRWIYTAIGWRPIIDEVERYVRFTALLGPLVLWIAVFVAAYFRHTDEAKQKTTYGHLRLFSLGLRYFLASLPWLVLFSLIAFEYSSTDNLNELIAGRGHILYFLLVLLPANAVLVALAISQRRPRSAAVSLVVVLLSLPVGWLLFKHGLSPAVQKYGEIFSGVDFLLGPDRAAKLPESTLMTRWVIVQLASVAMLACGIQVALPRPRSDAAAPRGPAQHTIRVNLRAAQATFLDDLSQRLGVDCSTACNRIIDLMLRTAPPRGVDALKEGKPRHGTPRRDEGDDSTRRSSALPGEPGRSSWTAISLTLDSETHEYLRALAKARNQSRSRTVRHLIAEFMKNLEEDTPRQP